jgi:hypothetical protein
VTPKYVTFSEASQIRPDDDDIADLGSLSLDSSDTPAAARIAFHRTEH